MVDNPDIQPAEAEARNSRNHIRSSGCQTQFLRCVTGYGRNLDKSQSVELSRNIFKAPISQNDTAMDRFMALEEFEKISEAQNAVMVSRIAYWSSLGVGAGAVGYGIATWNDNSLQRFGIFSGLIGAELLLRLLSDRQLIRAGEIYNKQFQSTKATHVDVKPFLSPIPNGAVAGIGVGF